MFCKIQFIIENELIFPINFFRVVLFNLSNSSHYRQRKNPFRFVETNKHKRNAINYNSSFRSFSSWKQKGQRQNLAPRIIIRNKKAPWERNIAPDEGVTSA